ncbi:hypothetical protein LV779_10805 [Streptomyces thinghirensis]|nr:hypothetical protein [Streptomyces thinghirensis]
MIGDTKVLRRSRSALRAARLLGLARLLGRLGRPLARGPPGPPPRAAACRAACSRAVA